jgi:fission process protein 1
LSNVTQLDSICSDVSYEAYKARRNGPSPLEAAHFSEPTRIGMVAVKRATFQSIASMCFCCTFTAVRQLINAPFIRALPAFTIHTAVAQARKAFASVKNPRVKTWAPTITGLAIVPILPYLFDHPVETATDAAFNWIEAKIMERDGIKSSGEKTEL